MSMVLLQVFVLVLHENGPIVDVDNANAIPAAGRNFGSRFRRIFWIGLEYNFPNLQNKIEWIQDQNKRVHNSKYQNS